MEMVGVFAFLLRRILVGCITWSELWRFTGERGLNAILGDGGLVVVEEVLCHCARRVGDTRGMATIGVPRSGL